MSSPLSVICHRTVRFFFAAWIALAMCWGSQTARSQDAKDAQAAAVAAAQAAAKKTPSKFRKFADVTKDAKKHEGLFDLYQKDNHLYAAIKSSLMNQPLLAPIAIARGMASAGTPLNFGDEWVLYFRRVGDNVHLVRKNIHFEAPKGSPLEKAVKQNYTDSVLMALPILSTDAPGGAVLVDFANIFMTDFANLRLGTLDRKRSTWHSVKTFKDNIELQVAATFARGGGFFGFSSGSSAVVDQRGTTVVIHYSLAKLPSNGYKPRMADQRVGHFLNATNDFGSANPDTTFVRRINRWHLEKANPKAKLSAPKKQIIWWVEDTVPHEYRPYVQEGILEWNKAFEKIGYRDALGVRWQNDRDEFDPEDINYCTFRWITTPSTFAMSGLRANPITGEMIDGDVIFDASWVRYWKQEYAFLMGTPIPAQGDAHPVPIDVAEIISPIMATRYGYGQPFPMPHQHNKARLGPDGTRMQMPELIPSTWSPLQVELNRRIAGGRFTTCHYAAAKRHEFSLAAIALAAKEEEEEEGEEKDSDDEDGEEKDSEEKKKPEGPPKLPEEFIGQAIKEVVMHEVGHSLGLRHNFKASSMLSLDEVNDTSITSEKGMAGSVMDYNPINIAGKGKEQGHYATTTIGPYDYWAIEYAYKPISGNEKTELAKIASRSPEPDLIYATDEDMSLSNDPLVHAFDLGSDPLEYGRRRMALAQELLEGLDDNVVSDGESWARLRGAFSVLLGEYGNSAYLASAYVGGQSFSRDFKGGENSRDPITPIPGPKQREAMDYLAETILSDEAFDFSPQLLRRLTMEHWYHWGSFGSFFFGGVDYPIYDRILGIQRIVLSQFLNPGVLQRIQNHTLLSDEDAQALQIAEVFRTLSDSVWSELAAAPEGKATDLNLSLIRRNLQRDHLRRLSTIVIGQRQNSLSDRFAFAMFMGGSSSYPADARSLARMHLKELDLKITANLEYPELKIDDATRAHLDEARDQIRKVLEAKIDANGL